jgi:hypothetical protein
MLTQSHGTMAARQGVDDARWPVISADLTAQAEYEAMRTAGESHKIAELLAMGPRGHLPTLVTDATFLESRCNGNQFDGQEEMGDLYKAEATAAGVDTTGKVYLSSLADYPGDPRAWVSGRGDVQKVCEERGYGCNGAVKVKRPQAEPPADVPVASDIVDAKVAEIIETQVPEGDRKRVDVQDLREQVTDRLKPHWTE